jgi:hypothetical protein
MYGVFFKENLHLDLTSIIYTYIKNQYKYT